MIKRFIGLAFQPGDSTTLSRFSRYCPDLEQAQVGGGKELRALDFPKARENILVIPLVNPEKTDGELIREVLAHPRAHRAVYLVHDSCFEQLIELLRPKHDEYLPLNAAEWQAEFVFKKMRALPPADHFFQDRPRPGSPNYDDPTTLIFNSPAMAEIHHRIDQVAQREQVTVLITGETGTGKQHVARLVHAQSPRKKMPFIDLDCTALPENLLEAELFGYEPGAFTDARSQKVGLLEAAQGGTVFLDEIGELPLPLQGKLLKVLEQKVFRRLGGIKPIKLDARIVAATNRDLEEEVEAKRFRPDLYYRVNVFNVHLPPLRDRRGDIPEFVEYFYADACARFDLPPQPLPVTVMDELKRYDWPGNVRELRNIVERLVMMALNQPLTAAMVVSELPNTASKSKVLSLVEDDLSLEEMERRLIRCVLKRTQGNKTRAAQILGISKPTLFRKIRKFQIS